MKIVPCFERLPLLQIIGDRQSLLGIVFESAGMQVTGNAGEGILEAHVVGLGVDLLDFSKMLINGLGQRIDLILGEAVQADQHALDRHRGDLVAQVILIGLGGEGGILLRQLKVS